MITIIILITKEFEVPGSAISKFDDEQVNWAGSGIQLPLLWHVTLRACTTSVEVSFSHVSVKTAPLE